MHDEQRVGQLIEAARNAMANAHAPYSRFAVGAAVRLTDGSIVTGCNFENASYGLSLCAETVALATVNAQGRFADVTEIAVVGGAMDGAQEVLVTPCGRCRQIMNEAEQLAGRTLAIYCATPSGDRVIDLTVAQLLPHAFGPADLGIGPQKKS
ncbi:MULTISPECIES: cytidine deaminase [Sphingobium]|uniref:Cytidine deaminase n=2 Tax=Sphingobium cupriresistens TaxID=1132417 RepID=A0A0J8AWJ6_9SPHN|nr:MULTISPECIES: cytidine deaminase [Sphingobium]KMS58510.1 cytidine deaminase [Sphingobium cupriresistens LL01]MBJ7378246.1 cytidine deaminase [Sphingobium sp.]RYM13260.1 cytidine deaminase [Sphingobium cupriresistens]WCP12373.1 Cytidine deaminase [Sphingobium sp. AntQ-1]